MNAKPLVIDLYGGLGGWAEGFLAEGWRVIGFDIERHDYGSGGYPGQLVIQNVLTLHGSQFRNAALIVGSPPCQAYSYRAMPWKRAKALPPPSNELFDACFRIQREASEAAGRYIPLIVENVRGAVKWVSQPVKWHFGSYYLWGDVPALMPTTFAMHMNLRGEKVPGQDWNDFRRSGKVSPHWRMQSDRQGSYFQHDGGKVSSGGNGRRTDIGNGARFTSRDCGIEGVKQHGSGREWFAGDGKISRITSSHSPARKAASAQIAKIPFPLAQHIARVFKP